MDNSGRKTEFLIEEILDRRILSTGKIIYLIKWRGCPTSANSWELAENCDCPALVQKFEEKRAKRAEVKPLGYARGLPFERIIAVSDIDDEVYFLVKWYGSEDVDLICATEVSSNSPEYITAYFEQRPPTPPTINELLSNLSIEQGRNNHSPDTNGENTVVQEDHNDEKTEMQQGLTADANNTEEAEMIEIDAHNDVTK